MTIEILRPDGAVTDPARSLAAAPDTIAGATIGVLDNTKPNAGVLLDRLAARLAERTGAVVGRRDTKNAAVAAEHQVLEGLREEVRIVLTGSAD